MFLTTVNVNQFNFYFCDLCRQFYAIFSLQILLNLNLGTNPVTSPSTEGLQNTHYTCFTYFLSFRQKINASFILYATPPSMLPKWVLSGMRFWRILYAHRSNILTFKLLWHTYTVGQLNLPIVLARSKYTQSVSWVDPPCSLYMGMGQGNRQANFQRGPYVHGRGRGHKFSPTRGRG